MRIFKVLFLNQLIIAKQLFKNLLVALLFFLVTIVLFCRTGSISFINLFILCIEASGISCLPLELLFEKKENMLNYLFTQGINKYSYIFSKLIIPVVLSFGISIIPMAAIFHFQPVMVSLVAVETTIILSAILWSLLILIFHLLLNGEILPRLLSGISPLFIILGTYLIGWVQDKFMWITNGILLSESIILLFTCYAIMQRKEWEIHFFHEE